MAETWGEVVVAVGGGRRRGERPVHLHVRPFLASLPAHVPFGHWSAAWDRQPGPEESVTTPSGTQGRGPKGPALVRTREGGRGSVRWTVPSVLSLQRQGRARRPRRVRVVAYIPEMSGMCRRRAGRVRDRGGRPLATSWWGARRPLSSVYHCNLGSPGHGLRNRLGGPKVWRARVSAEQSCLRRRW